MITEARFESFVKKANDTHKNKFDYGKFIYVNAKTKSIITCPNHGDFLQNPDKHLNSTYACPECNDESRSIRRKNAKMPKGTNMKGVEHFIEKIEGKFCETDYKLDLSNYSGIEGNDIGIFCEKHKIWEYKKPSLVLLNSGACSKCGREKASNSMTKNYNNFIEKAKIIHNDFYIYPNENIDIYKNRKSIIKIICPIHGEFSKCGQKHISGQGCFECRMDKLVDEKILVGGYNKTIFERNPELSSSDGILYYLSINDGECYKIGITRISIGDRIKSLKWKSNGTIYKIELLYEYHDTLLNVYNLEQLLLDIFNSYRLKRDFSTELFNRDISNEEVFKDTFKL